MKLYQKLFVSKKLLRLKLNLT